MALPDPPSRLGLRVGCLCLHVGICVECGVSSLVSWLVFSPYVTQHWTEHTLVGWLVTDGFAVRDAVRVITRPRSGCHRESPRAPQALSEGLRLCPDAEAASSRGGIVLHEFRSEGCFSE